MSRTVPFWNAAEDELVIKLFKRGLEDDLISKEFTEQSKVNSDITPRTSDAITARRGKLRLNRGNVTTAKKARGKSEYGDEILTLEDDECRNPKAAGKFCRGFVPRKRRETKPYCDTCFAEMTQEPTHKYT